MHVLNPYTVRHVEFLDQVDFQGWRIKVYGLSAYSLPLPADLVPRCTETVLPYLPQPAVTDQRYGVGFVTIHQGSLRNWFLLDWWEKEDIIHHRLFSSPLDDPGAISAEPDTSLFACVHELRVIAFESEAWTRTALRRGGAPSFDDYLALRMSSTRGE